MRIKKLAKAAENAFTDRLIMLGENEELFKQNCEKATRASTKATVIGKARVMKYEDILKEQRLREQKVLKEKSAPNRRCKRKQLETPQPKPKLARNEASGRDKAIRKIQVLGLDDYCTVIEF